MKIKVLTLGLVCLFALAFCKKTLPTSPDMEYAFVPVINYFLATPAEIDPGGSSVLNWRVINATMVEIDQGIGVVPLVTGEVEVSPEATLIYTLTATNEHGSSTESVELSIRSFLRFTRTPSISVHCPLLPSGGGGRIEMAWGQLENFSNSSYATNILVHVELPDVFYETMTPRYYGVEMEGCLPPHRVIYDVYFLWECSAELCAIWRAGGNHIPSNHWKIYVTWDTAQSCN